MAFSIAIVQVEGRTNHTVKDISDKLNERFQELKRVNPRGYRDAFDQRYELNCAEIAQEMGGVCTPQIDEDGKPVQVFDFTGSRPDRFTRWSETPWLAGAR